MRLASIWNGLEDQRGRNEQIEENSARYAWATTEYTTTGLGQLVEPTMFDFGMEFVARPAFMWGAALDSENDVQLPFVTADLPTFSCGVYQWRQNQKGAYTGAWCFFVVTGGPTIVPSSFACIFTLTWAGVASKNFIAARGFPVGELEM